MFFIFVISKTETNAIESQISSNIKSLIQKQFPIINKKTNGSLCTNIKRSSKLISKLSKSFDEPDETTTIYNKWLKQTGIIIAISIGLLCVLFYTVIRLSCNYCGPLNELIVENLIIFGLVGVIEYEFFMRVASKYVPESPTFLIKNFIETLSKALN
jgi:hypothetical protein